MPTENNDRITQAVLNQTIKNNTEALKEIGNTLKELDSCVRELQNRMTAVEVRQDNIEEDVRSLNRKSDVWNSINSFAVGIGTYLGWLK